MEAYGQKGFKGVKVRLPSSWRMKLTEALTYSSQ